MTSSDTYELHAVCAVGNFDRLQEMLASGKYDGQINQKDEEWGGRTPLHWCCIKGFCSLFCFVSNCSLVSLFLFIKFLLKNQCGVSFSTFCAFFSFFITTFLAIVEAVFLFLKTFGSHGVHLSTVVYMKFILP